jgi:hypothetical protein
MRGLSRHPTWRELNRLADDELDTGARARVREHVVACSRCSRSVSLIGELREAGRDMKHPSPPRDLLDDILQDRAEGLRVILPAVPPSPRPARRLVPAVAAAAIMAAVAGLATLTFTSEAGAGASELSFQPANPVPGEEIRLTYRPGAMLAGETTVKVRLRLRESDSPPPRGLLGRYDEAVLRLDQDGQFAGTFKLPPDFAYAAMAVEDVAGDNIDDQSGRFWSVRAHAEDGMPLEGALRQEFYVLQNRSWPEARDALRELTLLYPDRAEGWSLQLTYDQPTQLPAEFSASLASHRELFRRLEGEAERVEPPPAEMAAMVRYAAMLEDWEAVDRWLSLLEAAEPTHRLVVSYRVAGIGTADIGAQTYLENLWSVGGYEALHVCEEGFRDAVSAPEVDDARRWALRCLALTADHNLAFDMALTLVAHEETRERGISAVRALLAHIDKGFDDERPLHDTPAEVINRNRRLQALGRMRLGQQLLESGEPVAALLELDAAAALHVWLPELYRARLEALLSIGEQAGALSDFHRLNVDPVYPRSSVDSLQRRLPALSRSEAEEGRSLARGEMRQHLLAAQDQSRGLPAVDLLTSTGQSRSLESLVAGQPTILMVWDRRAFYSENDIADVIRAGQILDGGPGQLLWVTPELHGESLQSFMRQEGLEPPPYHDSGSELATRLGEWGTRGYFVIDRTGVIRTRTHSLMEAVRHLGVLQDGFRDTV